MSNKSQTGDLLDHNGRKLVPGMVLAYYDRLGWGEFDKDKSYFAVGYSEETGDGNLSFVTMTERALTGLWWSWSGSLVGRLIHRDWLPPQNFIVLGRREDIRDYMADCSVDWTNYAQLILDGDTPFLWDSDIHCWKRADWWDWPVDPNPQSESQSTDMNDVVLNIELISNELRSAMDYCESAGVNMDAYVKGVLFGGKK